MRGRLPQAGAAAMKIHEYQARALLADAGIPVPNAEMVTSVDEAIAASKRLLADADMVVVKAQVHAGGRGKAGFVTLCRSVDEVRDAATFMLGNRMVSPQTPPEGLEVTRLLVAAGVDIETEVYLAITTDRGSGANVLIGCAEGGVEIEAVAEATPDAIGRERIDPITGLAPDQAQRMAAHLGFSGDVADQAATLMAKLAELVAAKDASLAEINPLVVVPGENGGTVMAIDAKFKFDESALFRHEDLRAMADPSEEDPVEVGARAHGLNFIALDGTIGCLVNGAGLAMATMDIIKLHGGEPANFLDVGGSASLEAVTEAFRIILEDDAVEGILVNIFGGIMRCDVIAEAIVAAAKDVGFKVPLIVRLEGTNVEEARAVLEAARGEIPTMQVATDLDDAAEKVVAAVAAA